MSNPYYTHGSFPSTGAAATSASMRAELDLISAAFDKLPTLTSNANKFVVVNSTATGLTTTSTLPIASVNDSEFTFQDTADNTRKFQFVADAITPGATRLFTMPDADTTLVGTGTTQTLTNKTLTAPVIATIVNTGTLTLPTSTDTLVGRATTDTLTNKTLTNPTIGTILNTGTLTLPTSTDTLVGRATTDTLTNKTISGANNSLTNIGNSSLTNSAVTIGSSSLSLGGTLTTLAGVTISGASNTLSNIANASLTNSGVTFNGVTVALGASGTITASTTNALTIGTGLQLDTGTTFNGGAARTLSIDSTVATLSGSQTLSNKTISGSSNTLSNIANASLTNSSITIGSSSISLGSTASTISGLTSLSATGLIMTANAASSTAISAIAQSAGTVTVTAAGHGLTSGDLVSIDGVADYTYTGLVTVNVTNANVFTYSRVTTNASSSGGYVTKLQGTWASYSGGTGPAYRNGPSVYEANSQMPALRVTQTGNGYAFIVEDATNPDTSAFIISNAGDLTINTNKFTVAAATGNTLVAGTLDATGNFNVNTNKFTVAAATGNTLVAGTLDATGNFNVNTNKFTVAAATGNTAIAGTTSFGGNIVSNILFTDATYDIGASGANRPRDLFLSRNLTVGGTLTLAGGVNLNGNVTIGDAAADTLTVNSTITSNLIFTDNTYDIGASGATRPRSLFLGTNLTVGGRGAVGTISSDTSFMVNRNLTGSTSQVQIGSFGVVQSDVTSSAFGVYSYLQTAAASFTLPSYFHHAAIQGTIGAGSAVTNQYGYWVDGNMIGATNNYGFYGNIASGTGRYNLYMGGTAANYLGGATTVDSTLTVNNTTTLNNNVLVSGGYLRVGSGGSDQGTQLTLWSDSAGHCYMAGYDMYFNTGANNARTAKMLLTSTGRLTVGQGVDAGFALGVAGNVGVFDSSSNVSIGLQNTGSGGHGFRWLAGKTGDTFPGGFGFYDDTSLIYRMGVNSNGDVVFGSSSYSQLQNPSVALYPATGQVAIQAPSNAVAGLKLVGSSGAVAVNMGGIIDFYAPYRTLDYDQYFTGRIFAYRENGTQNVGNSFMGMQTSTSAFVSTYFLYADSSQRVSLNNKTLQTSYGLTSGRHYIDATGTDVSPTTGAAGLISVQGNGYASYWTMDTNGLYIGTNSNSRNIYIGTKGSVNNNPASLAIATDAENNTINANYYGVSIKSAGRQVSGYHIYDDTNGALWGLVGALTTSGTADFNDISNAHSGQGYSLITGTSTNGPGSGGYYHIWNYEYAAKDGSGNMTQILWPYAAGDNNWKRSRYSGTWSSWYTF